MNRVIVSVTNDIATDQRVIKTSEILKESGFEVLIIGRKLKNSLPFSPKSMKVKRFKLFFNKKFLFYAEYNIRLFFYLLFKKNDLYFANDLDTLLPNYLISRLKNKPLIYDSHEYFTGTPEIQNRPIVKRTWETIEKFIFPKLKNVITVNDSIAELYYKKYNLKPLIVRNVPKSQADFIPKTRKELGLPENKKIVLLQGSGINVDRGAEELLMSMIPKYGLQNIVLYFIGGGDVIRSLKKMTSDYNLNDRVFFLPKMNYNDLKHYTANADIGVSIDKGNSLNYKYSLPNKIFDYIMTGTPILASSLPEVEKIVKKYNVGFICKSHDPSVIAESIKTMILNEKEYNIWKSNTNLAAKELCWEKESNVLKILIQKIKKNK